MPKVVKNFNNQLPGWPMISQTSQGRGWHLAGLQPEIASESVDTNKDHYKYFKVFIKAR
jgi:hypothetical protein